MRRDFLRGLGIEDKDIIDKILDEHSADIGKAKGDYETLKTQVDDLTKQLKDKDKQIGELETVRQDNETLNNKIKELEDSNKSVLTEWEKKYGTLEKTHAIESGIRDAKGKNIKAITALLDLEKITYADGKLDGLSEQLETLTKGEDTGFLFGESKPASPAGTNPNNPPSDPTGGQSGDTFTNAIAKALGK